MIIPISSKKLQKYETYEATSALALTFRWASYPPDV